MIYKYSGYTRERIMKELCGESERIREGVIMINMRRRRILVCAAAMCMALALVGCSEKNDDGTKVSVIEGDDVKEYSSGSDAPVTDDSEHGSDELDETLNTVEGEDSVGGLAAALDIPASADVDIRSDNCGTVESACIKTDNIKIPDTDKMYTKKFTMGKIDAADRERILKNIFDEEEGVFEYPYDLKDEVSQAQRDAIFADKGAAVDYSKDYFIGKIDGTEYILYFFDQSWSTDEGFELQLASEKEVPEDMQKLGATFVAYMTYDSEELDAINRNSPIWAAVDEDNKCGLSQDEALAKAMDYMSKWGFKDVAMTSENEIYREYGYYDANGGDEACGYEKNGYSVGFGAAVTGQPLYQPEAFGVDTISHQSNDDNFNPDNYYYMEKSEYSITFDSDGLVSFICTWPMRSDEDAAQVGSLISWEEAVDSLQKCMPEHFADYRGYNKVEFNDVRLTYFRTKIGDGEYEAIPVYAFAQLDTDRGSDESYPIQLIMIDARDGSEVSIVQDGSRFGKN